MSSATSGSLPWRSRSQHDLAAKCVRRIGLLFEVGFQNYFTEMITILRRRVPRNIWVATSKVKVTAWPCSKMCPVHRFVIWSQILKLFHRNDHHIETTCHSHQLGGFLEGQGHSMTLHQNRVRPITLLFEVRFWNYFTEMITILSPRVVHTNLVASLKVKVTAWPCIKIVSGP